MRKELLAVSGLGEDQLGRWRELAAAASEPNPFFEPEFVLPAARALGASPGLLVATGPGGEWAGAVPVVRRRGWHRLPLRALVAWRHLYSFYGAPLLRAGLEREALACWLGAGDPAPRPLLGLDLLDAEGPARAALEEAAAETGRAVVVFERHERAALRRHDGNLDLGPSPKRRRENARLGRRLGDALGAELQAVDRGGDPAAVEDFLRLEASSWKGATGTAMDCDPAHARLLREACDGFRRLGRLQMPCLEAGGTVAAVKCNLLAGDTVFCFKTSFDESLGEFSPGVQLERALVDQVDDERRIELIDTCAEAHNEMANRVWPGRRRIVSLAVPHPGARGTLAGLAVRGLAITRQKIRRSP